VHRVEVVSVRLAWSAIVALAVAGCGASSSMDAFGGAPTSSDDAGAGDDVALPDAPLTADSGVQGADAPAPSACAAGKDGMSNVCVRVTRGAGDDAPPPDAALGIDSIGTLTVALASVPPHKKSDLVAITTFPSVSSGSKFNIVDLPKVAELSVPPGKYYVLAVFHDAPPFDRFELAVGDFAPRIADAKDLPIVDLSDPTQGVAVDLPVYPVRGFDVDVRLASTLKPLGSGAGPIAVRMNALDGHLLGGGILACGSTANGATATVRVLTTANAATYTLDGAHFDFATGPDDPSLSGPTLPEGTLFTDSETNPETMDTGWLGSNRSIELDRVTPFAGPTPSDPTSACYGVALTR
jgi:hypothetical protein